MTVLELKRARWDVEDPATSRVARGGARIAGLGLTTLATASRARRLRGAVDGGARERARVLRDASRRVLELHGVEIEIRGALPLGGALLASNHLSWLDPLVVASVIPCVPISKADVSGWPVVGAIARDLGVVFITRGDAQSGAQVLRTAGGALASGIPVLNFPEGTTTVGDGVLPFRKGLFGVARALAAPVVPVALRYDPPDLAWVGDASFVPHYLRLATGRRARVLVGFGEALDPGAFDDAGALAHAARGGVLALLQELR